MSRARIASIVSSLATVAVLQACHDAASSVTGPVGVSANLALADAHDSGDSLVEVVVRYRRRITSEDRNALAAYTTAKPIYEFRSFPAIAIRVPRWAVQQLQASSNVRYVDTAVSRSPLTENTGEAFLGIPLGHDLGRFAGSGSLDSSAYGTGISVGIIDSGIDCDGVADFGSTCASGIDFTGEDDPYVDLLGHGTKVASVIWAARDNGIGIRGIAPGVSMHPIRIAVDGSSSNDYSCTRSAMAIDSASAADIDILNLSYGGTTPCTSEAEAIDSASARGTLIIAGAGNNSDSVYYPARYPKVYAVSGLDYSCSWTCTTTFWSPSNRGSQIDFAALAQNVPVLSAGGSSSYASGTSFAAPIVTGIAALVMERWEITGVSRKCVGDHLEDTAYWDSSWSAIYYGAGMVDAYAAWSQMPPCDV